MPEVFEVYAAEMALWLWKFSKLPKAVWLEMSQHLKNTACGCCGG